MEIAILTNGYGLVRRGAERFTEEFYTYTKHHTDINVSIYGIQPTQISTATYTISRFEVPLRGRQARSIVEAYYFNRACYNLLKWRKFSIILNNSGFTGDWWLRKYRKLTGTPFVTRMRGGGREAHISKILNPDGMIFLTDDHKNKIAPSSPNTYVIPNGIDTSLYTSDIKTKSIGKEPVVLSVGAMARVKRHELTIYAMNNLSSGTLVIAGTPSDKQYVSEIVSLGKKMLGDRFIYLGEIPHDELITIYASADVFALPSSNESFGTVFLEAMASGLPIVTTNDQRRMSIISDAGVYCDVLDSSSYSEAIYTAYLRTDNKNIRKYATKFDIKNTMNMYITTLQEIIYKNSL